MASTYSPNLRIELIATGEQANTWGNTTNNNLGTLLEQAISGGVSVSVTAGNVTLSALDGASDQSRPMVIVATGTPGATRTITAPAKGKVYIVYNNSNASLNFIASGGGGVTLIAGAKKFIYCDSLNFYEAITALTVTSGTIDGTTIGATTASTGAFTTLSASSTVSGTGFSTYLASPPAIGGTTAAAGRFTQITSTVATGTAPFVVASTTAVANLSIGGNAATVTTNANLTGAVTSVGNATSLGSFTSAQLATALTNETGSGSAVFSASPTFTGTVNTAALTAAGAVTITGAFALRGSYGGGGVTSSFAAGDRALDSNTTTGIATTAVGVNALTANTVGIRNSAFGYNALGSNTIGANNTAVGSYALDANTSATSNTAVGTSALTNNTTGANNTAVGDGVMLYNTTGDGNTAVGVEALYSNTTGYENTAVGTQALYPNTTGYQNTAVGAQALNGNTTGFGNTALGLYTLSSNTTGDYNTALGHSALSNVSTGGGNVGIGFVNSAGAYLPVFDPTIESNRIVMGSTSVTNAYVKVAWTVTSDARDKTNFAPIPHGLDFVTKLQPTAYQFKENRDSDVATGPVRYGFKAQDVLALEGDAPVIIDNEDLDHLRINSDSLIPVLVNAIKELTARLEALEGKL